MRQPELSPVVQPRCRETTPFRVVAGNDAIPPTLALVAEPPAITPALKPHQAVGMRAQAATEAPLHGSQLSLTGLPVVAQADGAPTPVSLRLSSNSLPLERLVGGTCDGSALAVRAVRTDPIWRRALSRPGVVDDAAAVEHPSARPAGKCGCCERVHDLVARLAALTVAAAAATTFEE